MDQKQIRQLIDRQLPEPGLQDTVLSGVQLFRVTESVPCVPAVYEPAVVAIVSGVKEAVLDGQRHSYDNSRYLLCSMTLPVEAGTPAASPENPLLGVMISLDSRVMRELALEMENASAAGRKMVGPAAHGLSLARWDAPFSQALFRLLELLDTPTDAAVLGNGRLRELYYAVLKGEAGASVRRAFGVGNEIARTIDYLSRRLGDSVTIDDMAAHVGMSRAVFHRRFKEATSMSPIQFMKSMRLNSAAMKIATGQPVSQAAWDVGYVSSSQFSREFKRLYGQSPREWRQSVGTSPAGL